METSLILKNKKQFKDNLPAKKVKNQTVHQEEDDYLFQNFKNHIVY